MSAWSTCVTGEVRTVATGGFLTVTSVSPDGQQLIARRGLPRPAAPGHRGHPRCQASRRRPSRRVRFAACWPPTSPPREPISPRTVGSPRTAPPCTCGPSPAGNGSRSAWWTSTPRATRARSGSWPNGRMPTSSPTRSCRASSALLVWNVDGISVVEVRDLADGRSYQIDIGRRVMPGWSVQRDGRSAVLELTEPLAPRSIYHVDLARSGFRTAGRPAGAPGRPPGRAPPASPARRPRTAHATRSTDGLALQGLLYRPPGSDGPLPTVVLLHGGPESQERPAFSILIQSLVAAGFAVFAPNVRGSTGYGRDLRRAGRPGTAGVVIPGRPRDGGLPGRVGREHARPDRRARLVLRRLSRAGRPDQVADAVRVRFQPRRNVRPGDVLRRDGDLDGGRFGHRVRRSGGRCRVCSGSCRRCIGWTGCWRRPCWCTGNRTPTCRSANPCVPTRRCAAAGVPTELFLLPGEGHTIVGREGRIASTRLITEWHTRWTS